MDRLERDKDTVQVLTESAAQHVGAIASIITGAVRDVARETGDWFTDVFEMREASRRARSDEEHRRDTHSRRGDDITSPADEQPG